MKQIRQETCNPNEKKKVFPFTRQIVPKLVLCLANERRKKNLFGLCSIIVLSSYWSQFSLILIRGKRLSVFACFLPFYENHPILYRSFGRVIATLYLQSTEGNFCFGFLIPSDVCVDYREMI